MAGDARSICLAAALELRRRAPDDGDGGAVGGELRPRRPGRCPLPPPVTSTPQPSRPPVGFSCAGIALPRPLVRSSWRQSRVSVTAPTTPERSGETDRADMVEPRGPAIGSPGRRARGAIVAESSGRLLPQVTERNEFFWTSGSDSVSCGCSAASRAEQLLFPPTPVCSVLPLHRDRRRRGVRSRHRGGVHGERPPVAPGDDRPPYVIAMVAGPRGRRSCPADHERGRVRARCGADRA